MSGEKKVAIAEAVIDLAVKLGADQDLRLGEVIGHLEIAKMELYGRNLRMAQNAQNPVSEPSEDDGTEKQEASSPESDEDTGES